MNEELEIVYQDADLVVINKPAGMLVHRTMLDRHETRIAMLLLRDQIGQKVYPVHRLDKPTSGLLLFALSPAMAKQIGEQFATQDIQKQYLAIVRGYVDTSGCIDYALVEELDKIADAQAQQDKPAQAAVTHYERLATVELPYPVSRYPVARYSLVKISPKTGRKHQIRRHMKHISHPIVGDTTHGQGTHNRLFREHFACQRLLLAATELVFTHPLSGQKIELECEAGGAFSQLLVELPWLQDEMA